MSQLDLPANDEATNNSPLPFQSDRTNFGDRVNQVFLGSPELTRALGTTDAFDHREALIAQLDQFGRVDEFLGRILAKGPYTQEFKEAVVKHAWIRRAIAVAIAQATMQSDKERTNLFIEQRFSTVMQEYSTGIAAIQAKAAAATYLTLTGANDEMQEQAA